MLFKIKHSPAMMLPALTVSKEALYTMALVGGWLQADGIDWYGPSSNRCNINNVTLVQELQCNKRSCRRALLARQRHACACRGTMSPYVGPTSWYGSARVSALHSSTSEPQL